MSLWQCHSLMFWALPNQPVAGAWPLFPPGVHQPQPGLKPEMEEQSRRRIKDSSAQAEADSFQVRVVCFYVPHSLVAKLEYPNPPFVVLSLPPHHAVSCLFTAEMSPHSLSQSTSPHMERVPLQHIGIFIHPSPQHFTVPIAIQWLFPKLNQSCIHCCQEQKYWSALMSPCIYETCGMTHAQHTESILSLLALGQYKHYTFNELLWPQEP